MKAFVALAWLVALTGVGCGNNSAQSDSAETPAVDAESSPLTQAETDFWDAFLAGNVDAVPAARTEMLAAFEPTASDYEGARFIGMSYLLSIAEAGGPPSGGPPSGGPPKQLPSFVVGYFQNAAKY